MKEIKFRAWIVNECKMVEVDSIDMEHKVIDFSVLPILDEEDEYGYEVEPEYRHFKDVELMQFTGLKDKNGKEIYEGDIVKYDLYVHEKHNKTTILGVKYEVKYDDGLNAFSIVGNGLNGTLGGLARTLNAEIEVIGNIYENADLL